MLLVFLLFLAFGCYALWDTRQVEREAQSEVYTKYRPTEEDTRSFEDFQRLNPEVFGWLNVYGTNIDYPLVQGEDNDKYLNTAADGSYSLSGSLFLDYRNSRDMSDFNSIIYGHHMKDEVMFGELGYFKEKDYFDRHRYGQIFYGGKYYGLDFLHFWKWTPIIRIFMIREQQRGLRSLSGTATPKCNVLAECSCDG